MNSSKFGSALLTPRTWFTCAAIAMLAISGCSSDSTPAKKTDGGVDSSTTATGGKGTGGGSGAGGIVGTGGARTGGAPGTGGVKTDGGPGTGGAKLDGSPGTGGVKTDGGGTGGAKLDGSPGTGGAKLDGPVDKPIGDGPADQSIKYDAEDAPMGPDTRRVDGSTCGTAGDNCCPGSVCENGGCCIASNNGNTCVAAGSACTNVGGTCTAGACAGLDGGASCGGNSEECCLRTSGGGNTRMCTAGNLTCETGDASARCVTCGALNQPCCGTNNNRECTAANTECTGDNGNNTGTCTACGHAGETCCAGQTCTGTLNCRRPDGGGTRTCE